MRLHRHRTVTLSAVLLLALAMAVPGHAQRPGSPQAQNLPTKEDLQVGTFVQVEGRLIRELIMADQIEVFEAPLEEETLDAIVEAIDAEAKSLTILGRKVLVLEITKLQDGDKLPLSFSDIQVGQRAKAKGIRGEDGSFTARKVKVRDFLPDETNDAVKIEAMIEAVDLAKGTLVVQEMNVRISPRTAYKVGT